MAAKKKCVKASSKLTAKRRGPVNKKDVAAVERALERIRRKNNGLLTPEAVVAAAHSPKSVLHKYFEWDAKRAAQKYWVFQAREVIKCIQYHVTTEGEDEECVRVDTFVSVDNNGELPKAVTGRGYVRLETAVTTPTFSDQILQDALRDATLFRERYKRFSEVVTVLKPVFVAIDAVNKEQRKRAS